ncbi:MAG: hypothetical protein WBH03_08580, partial [Cyclobacteriaceae bacterium]
ALNKRLMAVHYRLLICSLALSLLFINCINRQQDQPIESGMDNYELSPDTAHPNAQKLLTEDFYWSPIDETGPFGSDDGSDAFYGFVAWRAENKNQSPVIYLNELIREWGYPTFNYNISDSESIKQVLNGMNIRLVIGQDNAIIAVGFGQFVLEGEVDNDIRELTRHAIERELSPALLNQLHTDYRDTRRAQLDKMLLVVDKM